jgi:hypothetical protein
VSAIYDIRTLIENKIKADRLDAADVRGKISLRAGKLLAFITPNTPDDPVAIAKLKLAAKEVLHMSL